MPSPLNRRNREAPILGVDLSVRASLRASRLTLTNCPLMPIPEVSLSTDVTRTGKAGKAKLARTRKDQVRLKCQSIQAMVLSYRAPWR